MVRRVGNAGGVTVEAAVRRVCILRAAQSGKRVERGRVSVPNSNTRLARIGVPRYTVFDKGTAAVQAADGRHALGTEAEYPLQNDAARILRIERGCEQSRRNWFVRECEATAFGQFSFA